MPRQLQECEIAAVGLRGVAEQQYRQRVHHEMAATHNARNQQARLDEVIRGEYHAQARAQQPVREAHGRAECAVDSANNDRQRAHRDVRCHLTECERLAQQQQAHCRYR